MSREMEGQLPEGGDALLAAEYVLGVQSIDLRKALSERIKNDPEFSCLVEEWETYFSEFNQAYQPVLPPLKTKTSIDNALFLDDSKAPWNLWKDLKIWCGMALGALALSVVLFFPLILNDNSSQETRPIVAALQSTDGDVRFLAYYELGTDHIRLSKVNAEKAVDRDYELWLIEADGVPQSIGIVTDQDKASVFISSVLIEKINAGDTFAISVEPLGGSPTGEVTGPVIAVGLSDSI